MRGDRSAVRSPLPIGHSVLVIEEDDTLRGVLDRNLADHGYLVREATSGRMALDIVDDVSPDAVLLDLELADVSGLDLLDRLVKRHDFPVLVISGRGGEIDRCVGLENGAADYLVKPISTRELLIRLDHAIGRSLERADAVITHGSLVIDLDTRDVVVGDRAVMLTAKEFDVLALLAQAPRRVFTLEQILEQVWGSSFQWQSAGTIYEHVHRLRRKLSPDRRQKWIRTVRGLGYRFDPGDN